MNAVPPTNSPIIAAFVARTPGSAAAYAGGALVGRPDRRELRGADAIARTPMPPICAPR